MRRVSLAFALLAAASLAAAQSQNIKLGVNVNAYFFTQTRLRDAFGDPALTYGVNLSAINRPRANKLSFAYDIISANRGDNTLFLLPFTAGYEIHPTTAGVKLLPYARIEGGVSYYDVAIHNDGRDKSFKTFGAVGAAEIGVVFNKVVALKAKYYLFQGRSGVNLSGAEVGITYNFVGL